MSGIGGKDEGRGLHAAQCKAEEWRREEMDPACCELLLIDRFRGRNPHDGVADGTEIPAQTGGGRVARGREGFAPNWASRQVRKSREVKRSGGQVPRLVS